MYELASTIRERLEALAEAYDRRLQTLPGYAAIPAPERLDAARHDLNLIAACLEAEDNGEFIAFINTRAWERVQQGFDVEVLSQALASLEETLMPMVDDMAAGRFLWTALSQGQVAISQAVVKHLRLVDPEQRFRRVADNIQDGLTVIEQGQVVYINDRMVEILGYSKDELSRMSGLDFAAPEEKERLGRLAREARQQGRSIDDLEFWALRKDGTRCYLRNRYSVVRDAEQVVGRFVFTSDITEAKQLEQVLQESWQRRGRQVQTGTEIAQEIAAATALGELYQLVVTLIKERFGYYHAQIFYYESALQALVLVAGYGEAGRRMLAQGHRLALGKGIVGTAAITGQPVLVDDVGRDRDWLPNPDLPGTQGELAVPIKLREQLLGVLDVQSDRAGALTQDDQLLLEGLCGQIAVAIESTRLREEMDENLRELDTLYRSLSQEGWKSLRQSTHLPGGYLFDRVNIRPAEGLWEPAVGQAVEARALVPPTFAQATEGAGQRSQVAAAAPLLVHGEVVGALGVYDDPRQPMSADELDLLEQVSEQVALALESARLSRQTQAALAENQVLYHLSRAISEATSVQEVLATVVQLALPGGADRASLISVAYSAEGEMEGVEVVGFHDLQEEYRRVGVRLPAAALPVLAYIGTEPMVIPDANTFPELDAVSRNTLLKFNIVATCLFPLRAGGRLIGIMTTSARQPTQFAAADVQILRSVTDEIAIVLESRRLFEQIQVALAETESLYHASARLSAVQSYDQVLEVLRQYTLLGETTCDVSLNLFDHPWTEQRLPQHINVCAYWAADAGLSTPNTRMPLARSAPQLLRADGPTIVADVAGDPRLDDVLRDLYLRMGAESVLFAPLVTGGQWIGYVAAVHTTAAEFGETGVRRLMSLVGQAATVVRSVQQLEETQRRAGREQILREVMAAISASNDLIASLPAVTQRVRELAPVDVLTLASYTPGEPEYTLFAVTAETEVGHLAPHGVRVPLRDSGPGWVIAHGQPWLEADMRSQHSFAEDDALLAEGVVSRLLLPLAVGERIAGTLNLVSAQPGAFTEEHLPILQQVADQVALALERTRLLEETREALSKVEETYRRYLRQEWQDFLEEQSQLPAGYVDSPTGLQVLEDLRLPGLSPAAVQAADAVSALAVPIQLRGETIGVLDLYQEGETRHWSPEERALVQAVVDQAAQTLERERLLEETQRRAARERQSAEIAARLRASAEVRSILQTAVRELGLALGASRAFVQMVGREEQASSGQD